MNRSKAQLDNLHINRRTLLGASMGAAAGVGLARFPAMAQDAEISGDVTYWHHFTSDSEMVGLENITAVFEEEHPGAVVISENIPNADFMTQFTTAAVGGSLPNTTMAAADRIPDMLALGGLIDLTERFNAWEGSARIEPNLMESATIDGQIYGIPAFLFVDWLYYRKDWFDEAGIAPPTTWDELQASGDCADRCRKRPLWLRLARRRWRPGHGAECHARLRRTLGRTRTVCRSSTGTRRSKAITFLSGLFTTDRRRAAERAER